MPFPENPHALAVSEKGRVLDKFTFADVETALKVLILNGGNFYRASELLAEDGIAVDQMTLRRWRLHAFPTRFHELRQELAPVLSEEVAARAMERAVQADDAEELYIQHAIARVDEVSPDKLAASVNALAKAKSENITKAQLLRERPTEIKEVRDTAELLEVLRRAGVMNRDPEGIVDAEVIEDEDPVDDEALIRARIAEKMD